MFAWNILSTNLRSNSILHSSITSASGDLSKSFWIHLVMQIAVISPNYPVCVYTQTICVRNTKNLARSVNVASCHTRSSGLIYKNNSFTLNVMLGRASDYPVKIFKDLRGYLPSLGITVTRFTFSFEWSHY